MSGTTVPKTRYTSPDFARQEWRMWSKCWLLAGRVEDVEAPGSFFTYEIGHESIVVVRAADHALRAFHNVCPHRGNRLVSVRAGRTGTFLCGYHGWDFALDGSLRAATDPETFPNGLPERCKHLASVAVDTWAGFVWVRLSPTGPPLTTFLGRLPELLAPYELDRHALVRDVTIEVACNWKVLLDNGNETYHVQRVHPQLLDTVDDYEVGPEILGDHSRFRVRFGQPSHRLSERGIGPGLAGILGKVGLRPDAIAGGAAAVRGALIAATRKHFAERGIGYAGLSDEQLVDNEHVHVFPNTMFNILPPGYWLFRARPHPSDPGRMYFDFQEYERRSGARAPRPTHRAVRAEEASLDAVLDQDTAILPLVQRGMSSSGFDELVLGTQEGRILHMHETLSRYLETP